MLDPQFVHQVHQLFQFPGCRKEKLLFGFKVISDFRVVQLYDFPLPRMYIRSFTGLGKCLSDSDAQRQCMLVLVRKGNKIFVAQHWAIMHIRPALYETATAVDNRVFAPRISFLLCLWRCSNPAHMEIEMPASGELIRMLNYVDDINATLRRIGGTTALITEDERKRLAEYMRQAVGKMQEVISRVEQGK